MENFDLRLFETENMPTLEESTRNSFICQLQDQALLKVTGEDAATFLHSQLSNDVERLKEGEARYAAYCSAKGRMLASFYYWKYQDAIFLQCAADLLPSLQKRLQMFVLRSKVKIEDVSNQFKTFGLGVNNAESAQLLSTPLPQKVNEVSASETHFLIRRDDCLGLSRYMLLVETAEQAASSFTHLQGFTAQLPIVNARMWRVGQIYAGIAQVNDKIKEQFVPQMLNFELIGGVNFRKGCYPGQEIVARSQYLGKLKRRMTIASIDGADLALATAGQEIFAKSDPEQPCGMIVTAEFDLDGTVIVLVEIKLAAHEEGQVFLGNVSGPQLSFKALPYAYIDVTE
ncbi:folate-binding protein [Undibacterium cyanobacteriorum]|uniref:Folate-binding protein n=1 Tax=Undibacterium cyanobacteriorum TaxID=3073561 RepID=A0ABY9RE22_9BURK|nr:folate-binding protein [Undibacterium sp. 20NA77.5]WMW78900.1 folate-binding protein [Undibacterium sp. 20NA77.5]